MRNLQQQKGFTLLEVMVVIVILGILAGLVVPNVMGNVDKANVEAAKADIAAFEGALDMYKLDNYSYPSGDQGLQALISKPDGDPEPRNYKSGGYIKKLKKDPWGFDYDYVSPGEYGDYDICSYGADGEEGGEENAADICNYDSGEDE